MMRIFLPTLSLKSKYIALDKVESICLALDVTPNDILEFIQSEDKENA